jgi:hypothetical protein
MRSSTGASLVVGLVLAIAGALALAGSSGADDAPLGSAAACSPAPVGIAPAGQEPSTSSAKVRAPAGELLACIATMTIDGATFDHWALVAERSAGRHRPSRHVVVTEVMGFLISSDWVLGEAAALGIGFTEAQVRQRFDKLRDHQFPHHGEIARFLRESGQTVADLLFRVRLNMLSEAIQNRVLRSARSARESQQRALSRFVRDFKPRWKSQTYCAPGYAVDDCGHIQAL